MTVERLTYTVPEAAQALGVSQRHLHNCIANGTLPARRLGRRVLIPIAALEEWLEGDVEASAKKTGRL